MCDGRCVTRGSDVLPKLMAAANALPSVRYDYDDYAVNDNNNDDDDDGNNCHTHTPHHHPLAGPPLQRS